VPEKFYDQLPGVMKLVPPQPGEEALYGWIASVFEAAAKDPEMKKALVESFVAADKEIISPLFQWRYNGRSAGNGWNSPVNNAHWGTDYLNRTGTAKSNMYDNKPEETKYIYTDYDAAGKQLHGNNRYAITFPKGQTPPVKGFWSLTLYNQEHFFHPNALHRYSLGTKNKGLKYNTDGSLTLYAGAKSPGKDKESNWLPAPAGTFSLYMRAPTGRRRPSSTAPGCRRRSRARSDLIACVSTARKTRPSTEAGSPTISSSSRIDRGSKERSWIARPPLSASTPPPKSTSTGVGRCRASKT
jgi:hypothetical protein